MATLKEQIEALVGLSIYDEEDEMLSNYPNEVISMEITSDITNNCERVVDVTFQCKSDHPIYGRKSVVTLFGAECLEIDDVQFAR